MGTAGRKIYMVQIGLTVRGFRKINLHYDIVYPSRQCST